MSTIEFHYFVYNNDEQVFESTAQAKLSQKDLKETELFILNHHDSPEFVDLPGKVYDKCSTQAYENAIRDFPELSELDGEIIVDLEKYIPVSLLMLLSDEVKKRMLTDEPYWMTEDEIFPSMDLNSSDNGQKESAPDAEQHQSYLKRQTEPQAQAEMQPSPLSREDEMDGSTPSPIENSTQNEEPYEAPDKENTLYLPIKQIYFNQIIEGTKKKEYREIKPTTYKKYLECDEDGYPYINPSLVDDDNPLDEDIYEWNNGNFPFIANEHYLYLHLAVGYRKERDEATVEIEDITFEPLLDDAGKPYRFEDGEDGSIVRSDEGKLCFWNAVFHLGQVVEVHRAQEE